MQKTRFILVGNPEPAHVGNHFRQAAEDLSSAHSFCDVRQAYKALYVIKKYNWLLRGRRPARLKSFSAMLVEKCRRLSPEEIIVIGIAPIFKPALIKIRELRIKRINYLTDDPFNKVHRAPWFLESLPEYDAVFSTRISNIGDLTSSGCSRVEYLPFAYNPDCFYPEDLSQEQRQRYSSDIVFLGGADQDRVPYITALINSGLKPGLYGGYWDRLGQTRKYALGIADMPTMRKVIMAAKIALCLVRRANRDGHSMRTFEIPAIGTCMLTEDTGEHRKLFGKEGEAVLYFETPAQLADKTRWLIVHDNERRRLAAAAHKIITQGGHTYKDRLKVMLGL